MKTQEQPSDARQSSERWKVTLSRDVLHAGLDLPTQRPGQREVKVVAIVRAMPDVYVYDMRLRTLTV